MPPKKDDSTSSGKMFSESTVAVLLMAMGTTSISSTQYEMMSALDGDKTASSFQHQFRTVLKKAKELKDRVDKGEKFAPVAAVAKRSAAAAQLTSPPQTPKKGKPGAAAKGKANGKQQVNDTNGDGKGVVVKQEGGGLEGDGEI
ncbi:unnamed protein product [Periconia digitata]|uniref:Uncharacterized protein n=1 Tax=Periconia digitata TaxID=1303443 RepID=A0A9W4XGX1_9PLEO|nr:unnamed protein product [Periconia digitata]